MKMILYIIGIIVALVGILGFFNNPVIGILDTNAVQSVVYIILGLLVIISIKKNHAMLTKIIGIIFAILGILGFILSGDTVFGILESTTAVDSFNLIVGVVLLIIGFVSKKGSGSSAPTGGNNMGSGMNNPQVPQQQPNNPQM